MSDGDEGRGEGAHDDEGQPYEMSPDEATAFDGSEETPARLNRKKVMAIVCVAFVAIVGGGLLINMHGSGKGQAGDADNPNQAARTPSGLLSSLMERSARAAAQEQDEMPPDAPPEGPPAVEMPPELPQVSFAPPPPPPQQQPPPPPPQQQYGQGASGPDPLLAARRSPLTPRTMDGSLFSQQQPAGQQGAQPPGQAQSPQSQYLDYLQAAAAQRAAAPQQWPQADGYAAQNDQANKQGFYDPASGGAAAVGGRFLGDNALWIGTMVPGVLETGINTDLPGNVVARVTQHVYDSQTGRSLLIPQGSVLVARYNSSVSYAQRRVQIVWDTLIRPDGFQVDLGGMPGADRAGMGGQDAGYDEKWFEYLKAAGIVAMFSVANASMVETAARYGTDGAASAVADSGANFVNQVGGNMVGRAMNIQPTLTVESGTPINVMLNRTVYLPPVGGAAAAQRYDTR